MPNPQGSAVIITNDQDQILLMQRGPKAKSQVGRWENVGGGVEIGETPEQAAKREVTEELGCEVELEKLLLQDYYSDGNETKQWTFEMFIFQGKLLSEPKITEPEKCSALKWFDKQELATVDLTTYTQKDFVKLGWLKI